jgi:hypothetical protein
MGFALDLGAAFFTFKGALRALKDFTNRQNLARFGEGIFFFLSKVFFIF